MPTAYPHLVVATITDPVGPIERGRKYEDPLADALSTTRLGEVTGGGTQLDAARQIAHVDLELGLADLDGAVATARTTLRDLGAPAGSVLRYTREGRAVTIDIASGAASSEPIGGDPGASDAPVSYDPTIVRDTAAKLLARYRSLFVDAYPLGPITREAYDADHFAWYDDITATLAGHGFTALGDLKIVKDASRPEPGAGPFARRFVSRDHDHRIDIFQLRKADGVSWARVINVVTELTDGGFVWTSTSAQHWNIPDHLTLEYVPQDSTPDAVLAAHDARLAAYRAARPDASPVLMSTLADVVASENRSQARTAAFRKRQGVPSVDELLRMGSNPTLAPLLHAEMHRTVFGAPPGQSGAPATAQSASAWHVTSVQLTQSPGPAMSFDQLIQYALDQGVAQVAKVGSPLNPFLVFDDGKATFFVCTRGDADPMEIALATVRETHDGAAACALVIDSRVLLRDGTKSDAIVVIASRKEAELGETWAQAYRPKGLLRSFKVLAFREQVATSKSLFSEALAKS